MIILLIALLMLLSLPVASSVWADTPAAELSGAPSRLQEIGFHRDVMAVLTKSGCNAGRCHGNASGRGGLSLSLRGQRPQEDYLTLTRDLRGRRINRAAPERSLMLLKATAQTPHEGGLRFSVDSLEYKIVHQWITGGATIDAPAAGLVASLSVEPQNALIVAPDDRVQLTVTAHWPDGSYRDVTDMAIYEPADLNVSVKPRGLVVREKFGETNVVVRYLNQQVAATLAFLPEGGNEPLAAEFPPENNVVDRRVFEKLVRLRIPPAPLADDTTFLRRLMLDLTGLLPTADQAREFAHDRSPAKRQEWIERVLSSSHFVDHWTLKWADLLRVEENTLDPRGVEVFHGWIRDVIANDEPLDEFAAEILTARGSTYEQPPANFYRAIRQPDALAEAVAQVFLGTRLQCAKCHDHPFDRWSQDDYYRFAALFAPIEYDIIENNRKDKFDKNQFIGEQIVKHTGEPRIKHPRSGKMMSAGYLASDAWQSQRQGLAARRGGHVDLESFSRWLVAGDQPQFARVVVNRVWAELMGRGLVEPVDDFRDTNPPSHPELLESLTSEFVRSGYRLRPLIRTIVRANAYQLASGTCEDNVHDERNYSHAIVRRMTAEQTLDSISQVTGVPTKFDGYDLGVRAGAVPGINKEFRRVPRGGHRFLQMFGKPDRLMTCTCERSNETALNQVFELTSGELLHEKITHQDNVLSQLLVDHCDDGEVIDALYWSALSRPPAADERAALLQSISHADDRRAMFEDLLWALMNSKEFLFRR